jgi:hypothetical protein
MKMVYCNVLVEFATLNGKKWLTEGSTRSREVTEVDLEGNTNAIRICDSDNSSFNITPWIIGVEESLGRKSCSINHSRGVIFNDRGIAKYTSNWSRVVGLCSNKAEYS